MSSMLDYQALIDRVYIDRDLADPRPPDGYLHPSAMGGCDRMAVYGANTEKSDPADNRGLRIMGRGTEIHEEVQTLVKAWAEKNFLEYLTEVKFVKQGVQGSADALLEVHPFQPGLSDRLFQLQEYKTINPNGLRYLKEPKPEHVKQARIYHWALSDNYYLTADIRFVYFDRDAYTATEFVVPTWTIEEVEEHEVNLMTMQAHVEEGTLPDKMPDDYWLCGYCNFKTICKGADFKVTKKRKTRKKS